MYKSISPVQTESEIQFIESFQPDTFFVPLDLETFLYCKIHKHRFLNPINYLGPSFHEEALIKTEKFKFNIPVFSRIIAIQSEFVAVLRYFFHQVFFIETLLNKIIDNEKINYIIVSGWDINSSIPLSTENYFTSRIVESLFGNKVKLVNAVHKKAEAIVYDYNFKGIIKTEVLVNSFGYNFKRLSGQCNRRNISAAAMVFDKLGNRQRIGAWLRGYKFIEFDVEKKSLSIDALQTPQISIENKDKENLINGRIAELMPHFLTQLNKCRLVDKFLEGNRPSFSASFSMRGIDGYLLERSHQLNIPSIAIPHGTIAPAFNKSDKIYKNIIAEAVFSGVCTHVALQSKITKDSLKTQTVKGEPIRTGNLIFTEILQNKRNDILYAVTLKDFIGMQFFGVEMYYEFMENLSSLVKLQESTGLTVKVKLHPSASISRDNLQMLFPMLSFTTKNLSNCLKNSLLTISYSSTVIEDSLYSNIPVILFDRWKIPGRDRY